MSLFERKSVATLTMRQLPFLLWASKSVIAAILNPFPISLMDTKMVFRR